MRLLDWVAAVVLALQLPIPLFWLIVHPRVSFWRRHVRAAFLVAGGCAWAAVAIFLYKYRALLFASERAPAWAIAAGFALLATDGYVLYRVAKELGSLRLVGHTELKGGGELATQGIYARVRHPRYTGMMLSVLAACLLAGTPLLWLVAGMWWLLALAAVSLEERELRARFGAAYDAYSKRVPRFLPFRVRPGGD